VLEDDESQVGVEITLMNLIENYVGDSFHALGTVDEFLEEDTRSHKHTLSDSFRFLRQHAHMIAHSLPHLFSHLLTHSLRNRHRRKSPWLRAYDSYILSLELSLSQNVLRHLCRFSAPSVARDHKDATLIKLLDYLGTHLSDGETLLFLGEGLGFRLGSHCKYVVRCFLSFREEVSLGRGLAG